MADTVGGVVIPPGPKAPTGRTISQPVSGEAHRILKNFRRTATDQTQDPARAVGIYKGQTTWYTTNIVLPDGEYNSLEQLRKDVRWVLEERLRQRGISPQLFQQAKLGWCLPNRLDQQTEWRLLLEDPIDVPTSLLQKMINLEPSTPNTKMTDKEAKHFAKTVSAVYYIREFTMSAFDANEILTRMLHDGYDMNSNIFYWMERIKAMQDSDTLTLRYCGQSVNRPWDRHSSDVYSTSLKSFLSQFYKTAAMCSQHVLPTVKVFTVSDATAFKGLPQKLQDTIEQVLIALFGDSVLNTEYGGKDFITLTSEDENIFNQLRTDTLTQMAHLAPCSQLSMSRLHSYAATVAEYVRKNETTRKGNKTMHNFSKVTEDMLVRQGTFQELPDRSAVMVSLGSDLGDDHEEDEKPFFEAGGRSADVMTILINHFGHWERGVNSSFDEGFTKNLAAEHLLPFVDYFPWFVKHKDDYNAASELTARYMSLAKPYIVLSYGGLPTYAAQRNFKTFDMNDHINYRCSIQERRGMGPQYWLNNILGVPQLAAFNRGAGRTDGQEFILIPCYHPGMIGHSGIMKEIAKGLVAMVVGLTWDAMGYVISLHQTQSQPREKGYRRKICQQLLSYLEQKLDVNHSFGKAFAKAKSEFAIASTADAEARQKRNDNVRIRKPDRNILPAKTGREWKDRKDKNVLAAEGLSPSFEVAITQQAQATAQRPEYLVRWAEHDGVEWSLNPIHLPNNVVPDGMLFEKRFLVYTATGIDIRNEAGDSLGDREPVPNRSGSGKAETLPIAGLALMLQNSPNAGIFLAHWEMVTGCSVNQVIGSKVGVVPPELHQSREPYIPATFFAESDTKRGLPVISTSRGVLTTTRLKAYIKSVKSGLPANPGDLLWLLDRFFTETFPNGGKVDLCPGSLHAESVYNKIAAFCAKAKYMHHPHWRTLLALANMTEMGLTERMIPANFLILATQVLREPFSSQPRTKNGKCMGESYSLGRQVIDIGNVCPDGLIVDVEEPPLVQDIEDIESDDEDDVPLVPSKSVRKLAAQSKASAALPVDKRKGPADKGKGPADKGKGQAEKTSKLNAPAEKKRKAQNEKDSELMAPPENKGKLKASGRTKHKASSSKRARSETSEDTMLFDLSESDNDVSIAPSEPRKKKSKR